MNIIELVSVRQKPDFAIYVNRFLFNLVKLLPECLKRYIFPVL